MKYAYGTPSHVQHQGLWKSSPSDPDVTETEYHEAYLRFNQWLEGTLAICERKGEDVVSYFVGDFRPDRSQQLEFYDFSLLTPEFVRNLQEFLQKPENRLWRVGIPASDPRDVLTIYPKAVCSDQIVPETEQDLVIKAITERHIDEDCRRSRERLAGIDAVRPWLTSAFEAAELEPNSSHLIQTEITRVGQVGIVRMWVLHPRNEKLIDLFRYVNTPPASLCERYYLLAGGILLEAGRPKPANAFAIARWEFEEDQTRSFVMQRGDRTTTISY